MAISSTQSYVEYTGDSSTKSFSIPFYFLLNSDISVMIADGDGNITELTNGTDFSVTGQGISTGGTCAMNTAYSDSYSILIYREPQETQETKYYENGKFPAKSHESALDKLTMLIQRFGWIWDSLALKRPNYFADYFEANGHRIANLQDPTQPQDAATKNYVDGQVSAEAAARALADSLLKQRDDQQQIQIDQNANSYKALIALIGQILAGKYDLLGDYSQGPYTFSAYNQLITKDGYFYALKESVTLPYTTTGNTATSWATDESNFVAVGDAALRQELSGYDGLKYIGRCPDVATLRAIEPSFDGQVIILDSYDAGTGVGGGELRYDENVLASNYPDDGVIRFVTAGGKVWTRIALINESTCEVPMEWGGVVSTYEKDQSARVQAVFDAAATWAKNVSSALKATSRKVAVKPTMKLLTNKTINFNMIFVDIEGCYAEWAFAHDGTYDTHPTSETRTGTAYKYCLGMIPEIDGSTWSINAYRVKEPIRNLNLYLATSFNDDDTINNDSKVDNGIIAVGHYATSPQSTLQTAQFKIPNFGAMGFASPYMNGDYAWGGMFYDPHFSDNYYAMTLIGGADNGERFSIIGGVVQNNYHALKNWDWEGAIVVDDGSWVWNSGCYFDVGIARAAIITPNHVEYVNSTSPIVRNSDAMIDGTFYRYKEIVFRPATLVISHEAGADDTNIVLYDIAERTRFVTGETAAFWNSADLTPNMKLVNSPDAYLSNTQPEYIMQGSTMNVGLWSLMALQKPLLNGGKAMGLLANCVTVPTLPEGATAPYTISYVNENNVSYIKIEVTTAITDQATFTIDIPMQYLNDWWGACPVAWLENVVNTGNNWYMQWQCYNKAIGLIAGTDVIGTVELATGDTQVIPQNAYSRNVQYMRKEFVCPGVIDTCRLTFLISGAAVGDGIEIHSAGIVTI